MKSTINHLLIFLIGLCPAALCQDALDMQDSLSYKTLPADRAQEEGFDFFASEEPLTITLYFDIKEFLKTKNQEKYQDARMTIRLSESDSISQDIKLRSRGFMRLSYCSFPPIMLKFGGDVEFKPILDKGSMKLVTHCCRSAVFEGYVFKEYLIYRMYNLVTPYSFKTRLVEITYKDIHRPAEAYTEYGFLIENEEQMARRNNAVVIKTTNISQKNMNPSDMARVAVFNYMIGNTDWSVPYQHNIKVLKSLAEVSDKGIPVAYDFDYAGLVNTMYSAPAAELPIKSVLERYYLGLCLEEEELMPVYEELYVLKDQFLTMINEFEYLTKGEKKQVETYLNSFYKLYRYRNLLSYDITCTCKQY